MPKGLIIVALCLALLAPAVPAAPHARPLVSRPAPQPRPRARAPVPLYLTHASLLI